MDYMSFLQTKQILTPVSGFDCDVQNSLLFDWQRDVDRWALRRGKAAIFADCGNGKTAMQIKWAQEVSKHTGMPVLILAPLAVAQQTKREGDKFDILVTVCRTQRDVRPGVNVANYEMLEHFDPSAFGGIVLDESSILKAYMGRTKIRLVDAFRQMPYRLCCTATPAPNDHMELLNHAEFLGIMESSKALSIWFINDTSSTGTYRLKGHAEKSFWEWVSSWAVCMGSPSDIGYSDEGFVLPQLNEIEHVIDVDEIDHSFTDGFVRKIETNATAYHKEKRITAPIRAVEAARIATETNEQILIWCETNYEADELRKVLPGAVEVRGTDKAEAKERAALDFIDGKIRVLISKPDIFGFGLNFQNCHNAIFCGLSYSYEKYYQAIRRLWRFGQTQAVNSHIIIGSTERQIIDAIRRKAAQHEHMRKAMYSSIRDLQTAAVRGVAYKMDYDRHMEGKLPGWLKEAI